MISWSLFALAVIDEHIKNTAAPMGIVSFELCAYQSACTSIQASWDATARIHAAMSLGLDHLFMLAYPAAISFGLQLLLNKGSTPLRTPMAVMAHGIWVAGLSDAVENYHLFQMLLGHTVADHQWPASLAATLKFAALVPALALWLFGLARFAHTSATERASAT